MRTPTDGYVPFGDGQKLFASVGSTRKESYEIAGANHATMFSLSGDKLRGRIATVIRETCPVPRTVEGNR